MVGARSLPRARGAGVTLALLAAVAGVLVWALAWGGREARRDARADAWARLERG